MNVQNFKKYVLDTTTFRLYDEKELFTTKKLALELTNKYASSLSSMHTVFKSTGFKYRTTSDGYKFLMEGGATVATLIMFLTVHNLKKNMGQSKTLKKKNTFGTAHWKKET
jgi:hypothetical protein